MQGAWTDLAWLLLLPAKPAPQPHQRSWGVGHDPPCWALAASQQLKMGGCGETDGVVFRLRCLGYGRRHQHC